MKCFVVDRHLGHLARWLRTLGQDAFFEVDASHDTMRQRVAEAGAVFVTTRQELADAVGARAAMIVPKSNVALQLQKIRTVLDEPIEKAMFTRCVICNVPVRPVAPEEVRDRIPHAVLSRTASFTTCPVCLRVYWEGTHTQRLRQRLAFLLSQSADPDPRAT